MRRGAILLLLIASEVLVMFAQKPEPTSRRLEVSPSTTPRDTVATGNAVLPKLELPEYIITGIASMDLPVFEKEAPEESVPNMIATQALIGTAARELPQFGEPQRRQLARDFPKPLHGSARASMGRYFTPALALWVGGDHDQLDYHVSGDYFSTKGYAYGTDRSRGGLDGGVRLILPQGPDIRVSLGYEADRYHFFGTPLPLASRGIFTTRGGFALSFPDFHAVAVDVMLQQEDNTIRDSSVSVGERLTRLRLNARIPTSVGDLRAAVQYDGSTISRRGAQSLSIVKLFAETDRYWWQNAFAGGRFGIDIPNGSGSRMSFAPELEVGYHFHEQHILTAQFRALRQFESLRDNIRRHRFLSAQARVPIPATKLEVSAAAESQWRSWLRSKITAGFAILEDDPRYVDSAGVGVWMLKSDGRTNRTSARLELFANITAIDYFGVALFLQTGSNNGRAIPYLPAGELSVSYTREFPFGLTISPTFSYTGRRWTDEARLHSLPGFPMVSVEARYRVLDRLSVLVRGENLMNTRYDLWKGYRAEPLMLHAGIRYAW